MKRRKKKTERWWLLFTFPDSHPNPSRDVLGIAEFVGIDECEIFTKERACYESGEWSLIDTGGSLWAACPSPVTTMLRKPFDSLADAVSCGQEVIREQKWWGVRFEVNQGQSFV